MDPDRPCKSGKRSVYPCNPMSNRHGTTWAPYAKALLAVVVWGSSFIALRLALDSATPYGVVWMRNLLGALFLFGVLRWRGGPLLPEVPDRPRVLALGLLLGVHLLIQSWAIERTSTMHAGWIVAFIPAVVALGAWLFLRERMRAIGWAGIVVASLGVLVLTATGPAQFTEAGTGDLLMFISTFTWAAYTLLVAAPARGSGGLRVSASALLVAALPNLVLAGVLGSWHAGPLVGPTLALLFLGLGASGLALWLYSDAVAALGPERSSAFQYVQPFVTVVVAAWVLGEVVTPEQRIAGPAVLVGVWLVQRGKRLR
jgi:drug/metabolite transporter (DMT)-like permease